jgi:hypothetical protein
VVLTRGTSYENKANLAAAFWDQVITPYEDTPLGRQEIFAEILNLTGEGFISGVWIEQALAVDLFGAINPKVIDSMPLDLGVDVAGRTLGGDDTVIAAVVDGGAAGKLLQSLEHFNGQDTMATVGEIVSRIEELEPRSVRIDDTAIGNGVSDRLIELRDEPAASRAMQECELLLMNFGGKAFDSKQYADIRTELWWNTGELLRTGKLDLLPEDLDLAAELARPSMGKSSNGRLKLESKDSMRSRGVDSPDAGDALALACYPDGWFSKACAW